MPPSKATPEKSAPSTLAEWFSEVTELIDARLKGSLALYEWGKALAAYEKRLRDTSESHMKS